MNKPTMPSIVCLCGSTRFMPYFFEAGYQFTLAGEIVVSIAVCKHSEASADGAHGAEALGPDVVRRLDDLHFRKIDLADRVFILNVGGYIGESTCSELAYAMASLKPVTYLEPELGVKFILDNRKELDRLIRIHLGGKQ